MPARRKKPEPPAHEPTVNVRLSGSGGQGLILAGRLLAEAAALHDGLDVVQTNSYGPEARGGASRSDVVLGRGEIDDLHPHQADVLVCLNQASCDAFYQDLAPNGLLITDSDNVKVVPTTHALEAPMTALSRQVAGTPMAANVAALAVLAVVTKIVTRDALQAVLKDRLPAAHLESNRKVLDAGFAEAEAILARMPEKRRAQLPDFGDLRAEPTALSAGVSATIEKAPGKLDGTV